MSASSDTLSNISMYSYRDDGIARTVHHRRAPNHGVIGGVEGGKGEIKTQYKASQFALIVS